MKSRGKLKHFHRKIHALAEMSAKKLLTQVSLHAGFFRGEGEGGERNLKLGVIVFLPDRKVFSFFCSHRPVTGMSFPIWSL